MLGGDLNVALDPIMDASRGSPHHSYTALKWLKKTLFHQLVDDWRIYNPSVKDYLFYFHSHNLYSRINDFLLKHHQLPLQHKIAIGLITIIDHAPI